jgi:hypothetical protein
MRLRMRRASKREVHTRLTGSSDALFTLSLLDGKIKLSEMSDTLVQQCWRYLGQLKSLRARRLSLRGDDLESQDVDITMVYDSKLELPGLPVS